MRKTMRVIAVTLGLAAAGAAMAQGYGPGVGGYGPGMMGGGYGPGMMGSGPLSALDLKDDQRDKIFAIQEEARSKNFGTMTQIRAEQYKLTKLYNAEKADPKAIGDEQKKVDELRRQIIQSHVDTRNQVEAVLTAEQKKQLRQYDSWWAQPDLD